jgi:hypothetical protein
MGRETIFVLHFISCLNVVVGSVVLYSVKRDGCVIKKGRYVMIWNQFSVCICVCVCVCVCGHVCVCWEGYYPSVCPEGLGETT